MVAFTYCINLSLYCVNARCIEKKRNRPKMNVSVENITEWIDS